MGAEEAVSYTYEYPRPALTADVVAMRFAAGGLQVLLIRRGGEPFRGKWALPGGFVDQDESVEQAAARELAEETGLEGVDVEQLHTFSALGRDPRGHTVSVAHLALLRALDSELSAGDDAGEVRFVPVQDAKGLAFDHDQIVQTALERLRFKARHEAFGLELLAPKFTLSELQRLYEVVLERALDKRNFRKKMLARGLLSPTGELEKGVAHRAARFFRFDRRRYKSFGKKALDLEG
jgi:8-oxo-dGTP diphosphatase